jgi:hypothetical protein
MTFRRSAHAWLRSSGTELPVTPAAAVEAAAVEAAAVEATAVEATTMRCEVTIKILGS